MKSRVIPIFHIVLIALFSIDAFGLNMEGRVVVKNLLPHIRLNGRSYPLRSTNFDIQTDINKLKNGDFISGTGLFSADNSELFLDSINSVGLVDLIGIWHTPKWDVFEFLDFSHLNLYVSRTQLFSSAPSLFGFQTIRYSISPGFTAKKWSILLVDPQSVKIGTLSIRDGRWLEIEILDEVTGAVIQKVTLSKLKGMGKGRFIQ